MADHRPVVHRSLYPANITTLLSDFYFIQRGVADKVIKVLIIIMIYFNAVLSQNLSNSDCTEQVPSFTFIIIFEVP